MGKSHLISNVLHFPRWFSIHQAAIVMLHGNTWKIMSQKLIMAILSLFWITRVTWPILFWITPSINVCLCLRPGSKSWLSKFGLDRLILMARRAWSWPSSVLDCLKILCTFGHNHTRNNVSVHIRTAPVTSHLDPSRKQRHALTRGMTRVDFVYEISWFQLWFQCYN